MAGYVAAGASGSVVENVTARFDNDEDLLATVQTPIKVRYLVARLTRVVTVVALHEFDTFLVARAAATRIRGMLLHMGGHVPNVEVGPAA